LFEEAGETEIQIIIHTLTIVESIIAFFFCMPKGLISFVFFKAEVATVLLLDLFFTSGIVDYIFMMTDTFC
jgi:hypothetical protein